VSQVEKRLICGSGCLKDNGIEGFGVGTYKEGDKERETGLDTDYGQWTMDIHLDLCCAPEISMRRSK